MYLSYFKHATIMGIPPHVCILIKCFLFCQFYIFPQTCRVLSPDFKLPNDDKKIQLAMFHTPGQNFIKVEDQTNICGLY